MGKLTPDVFPRPPSPDAQREAVPLLTRVCEATAYERLKLEHHVGFEVVFGSKGIWRAVEG